MENYELDKLRSLQIEEVAERLGMTVSRHKSLCIFHSDSHPSLSFKHNRYRCFVCGASGDGIDLVMKLLGVNFMDACRWLADKNNIILTEHKTPDKEKEREEKPFPKDFYNFVLSHSRLGPQAEEFLFQERKLSREVIQSLGIGAINQSGRWFLYCMSRFFTREQLKDFGITRGEVGREHCFFWTPCLLFPYRDIDDQLIGIQSRYIGWLRQCTNQEEQARHNAIAKQAPRFQFSQGSHPSIFNLPVLKDMREDEELWISEGVTDTLALLSAGKKAIAIPSATLLTKKNRELLALGASRHWHIYPDKDAAGERLYQALLSAANELGASLTRHELPEGCKDFADFWKQSQP